MANYNSINDDIYEKAWAGTELKFLVNPEASGFYADDDDWSIEIRYGSLGKTLKVYQKSDLIRSTEGYICVIDTQGISGMVYAVVTAYVNDSDCEDGLRREVVKKELCYVLSV